MRETIRRPDNEVVEGVLGIQEKRRRGFPRGRRRRFRRRPLFYQRRVDLIIHLKGAPGVLQCVADHQIVVLDEPLPEKFVGDFEADCMFALIRFRADRPDPGLVCIFSHFGSDGLRGLEPDVCLGHIFHVAPGFDGAICRGPDGLFTASTGLSTDPYFPFGPGDRQTQLSFGPSRRCFLPGSRGLLFYLSR